MAEAPPIIAIRFALWVRNTIMFDVFVRSTALFLLASFGAPGGTPASPDWQVWSANVFARAKQEHRFVLLDLEAVWCHWCHVMDATTYQDPETLALLKSKYITVRVDQDSRPDLSNRYEDYGWPATIVFDGGGHEIVKRQGYIAPREMTAMLRAIIADPTPGPSVVPEAPIRFAASHLLTADLRRQLQQNYREGYDSRNGSWGTGQKFLDWDGVEYAMSLARKGDDEAEKMARQTLQAQLNLVDPAWGGVYQYSTDGDWKHPHFEKIMQFQAENLRIYAMAYEQWQAPEYLQAAMAIRRYLKTFLTSPEGAFYTSQDADLVEGQHSAQYFQLGDAARRRRGIPRVDKHIYARENGWAITALAVLYQATSDETYLADAKRAAQWSIEHRALEGGGFRHDEKDAAGPYLGDTLAMTRAFLALYNATGERQWLQRAESSLRFIAANFRNTSGAGYLTAHAAPTTAGFRPHPERDENVALARAANLTAQFTGNVQFTKIAEEAMRYVVTPRIAQENSAAPALLAEQELTTAPLHLTVVGHKDDPEARALFQAAMRHPSGYKRVEWWDAREGRMPNPDVQYPKLKRAAAFVCTEKSCSSPIFQADQLLAKAARLAR
jgi:hypothetical protein